METEELCSINISPLVVNPFAVQWSPDNHISIITEKGVHVLVSCSFIIFSHHKEVKIFLDIVFISKGKLSDK